MKIHNSSIFASKIQLKLHVSSIYVSPADFLIQGSREQKLSIVFLGKKLSDDVIIQILP
jgi:hypothetical protein